MSERYSDYTRIRKVLEDCFIAGYWAGEDGADRSLQAMTTIAFKMEELRDVLDIEWDGESIAAICGQQIG